MPTSKGYRRKTRQLLRKRGDSKRGLSTILRQYNVLDKIVIDIDPTQCKGMPHRRFQGRVGVVEQVGKRSLTVKVPTGGKTKTVTTRLEHVKPHLEAKTIERIKE